ncbi:hypothetical protein ACFL43_06100 [Thermodesulfobacteriota bacterium]
MKTAKHIFITIPDNLRRSAIARIILPVFLSFVMFAGCNDGSIATIKIAGLIFSLEDGSPIQNAVVFAVNKANGQVSDMATTGADGSYAVEVESAREGRNKPVNGAWDLNVAAAQYMAVPSFIRPSIAVTVENFIPEENNSTYSDTLTDIGLASLKTSSEMFTVSGSLAGGEPGALVVLEDCSAPPCPYGYTAGRGNFIVFNVPPGSYSAAAYKKEFSFEPTTVEIAADTDNVVINQQSGNPTGTVSGSVNIVNPGDGDATSVVLVPESLFHEGLEKGILVPGLRAPDSGDPDVTGAYSITGVPEGSYVVLAAFENDHLVRDPDPNIAGTQIVRFTMPDGDSYTRDIDAFKITGALNIVSPGAGDTPEALSALTEVVFEDDSSEDQYDIVLFSMYGDTLWVKTIAGQSGGTQVSVAYDGPALESGIYYQWKVTSSRKGGPIATSEDLKGIFYIELQ